MIHGSLRATPRGPAVAAIGFGRAQHTAQTAAYKMRQKVLRMDDSARRIPFLLRLPTFSDRSEVLKVVILRA